MAGPFDWLSSMGGSSAPGTKSQYYQQMANGTHLVSVLDNGQVEDQGVVSSKPDKALTDKPVVKSIGDGSTWAFKFNPDGTVANSVQVAAAGGKPVDPALEAQRDSRSKLLDQQLANAEAMAPYNLDKARATIANLSARTDLEPAQKELINARVQRIASQNNVDVSRIGLNEANTSRANAQTSLYTIEGQMKLKNAFYQAQQEVNTLRASIGQPGGPQNEQEADALAQQIFSRAAREAATGISAGDEAKNALTAQRQQIDQGNNRASQASSIYNSASTQAMDAAKNGAGGPAAAGGFLALLNNAPGFQASMGGAPVAPAAGVTAAPASTPPTQGEPLGAQTGALATPDHKQQIAALVMGGMSFRDAVHQVAAQAGVVLPDDGGGAGSTPTPSPAPGNFLSNLNPGVAQGAAMPGY